MSTTPTTTQIEPGQTWQVKDDGSDDQSEFGPADYWVTIDRLDGGSVEYVWYTKTTKGDTVYGTRPVSQFLHEFELVTL